MQIEWLIFLITYVRLNIDVDLLLSILCSCFAASFVSLTSVQFYIPFNYQLSANSYVLTCSELKMVNRYANTRVPSPSFTASSPSTHVMPRSGRSTIEALRSLLH